MIFEKNDGALNAFIPSFPYFSGWLSSDVSGFQASIKTIQRKIRLVSSGKLESWELEGNAYVLIINPGHAVIFSNVYIDDDIEEEIDINFFDDVLQKWLEFLISPNSKAVHEISIA